MMQTQVKDFELGYHLIEVTNKNGVVLSLSDLGARIVSLKIPSGGELKELVLGFDSATEYLEKDPYIGSTIGRTAGRIAKGKATIGGKEQVVEIDPVTGHSLHGGLKGFEQRKWAYEITEEADKTSVRFSYISPAGENGFPGEVAVTVSHSLNNQNEWSYEITGTTDEETLFNPTNHVYFNLNGSPSEPIDEHTLWVDSSAHAEITAEVLPTGQKRAVAGTAFDFQTPKKMSQLFTSQDPQSELVAGLDHPFFLGTEKRNQPQVQVSNADQTVSVTVSTNQSSVVIFTANFGETGPVMHGEKLVDHGGITFETQTAPGAEHFPEFGSIVLQPGETARNRTTFRVTF